MNEYLTETALKARRAYLREWRKANADKVKQQQARYWEKKAAQMANESQHSTQSDNQTANKTGQE